MAFWKVSDEVDGDGFPGSRGRWKRLQEAMGFVGRWFDPLAGVALVDKAADVGFLVGPIVVASYEVGSLVLS